MTLLCVYDYDNQLSWILFNFICIANGRPMYLYFYLQLSTCTCILGTCAISVINYLLLSLHHNVFFRTRAQVRLGMQFEQLFLKAYCLYGLCVYSLCTVCDCLCCFRWRINMFIKLSARLKQNLNKTVLELFYFSQNKTFQPWNVLAVLADDDVRVTSW